jgi:cytochrome c peroxidase
MSTVFDRFSAPSGPTGVAVTSDGATMVVFGEHAGRLRVVDLASRKADDVALPVAAANAFRRGRELFYASDDRGISFDGLACASCHPDGGDDGLTWSTPEGPRQTPMLAGRLVGTAPYGWDRGSGDLEAYIEETVRRLRGTGLSITDLRALASYVERLPAPPRREPSDLAATGRDVFFAQGCASCHEDAGGTDRRPHAVEPGTNAVDTPSLRFVGATAPYFHDGRYASLESILTHSKMGSVESLNADQRTALVAFLASL